MTVDEYRAVLQAEARVTPTTVYADGCKEVVLHVIKSLDRLELPTDHKDYITLEDYVTSIWKLIDMWEGITTFDNPFHRGAIKTYKAIIHDLCQVEAPRRKDGVLNMEED